MTFAAISAFAAAATLFAPTASADMNSGNYELRISGRYDFHTWAWSVARCVSGPDDCRYVSAIPMPNAKAFPYTGEAHKREGRYTLAVDVPDGLRCGNVYYGPVVPTHDVYSWDPVTLQGTLESSFTTGCDGAPGVTNSYPFTLAMM
jgi:hypothetical protein